MTRRQTLGIAALVILSCAMLGCGQPVPEDGGTPGSFVGKYHEPPSIDNRPGRSIVSIAPPDQPPRYFELTSVRSIDISPLMQYQDATVFVDIHVQDGGRARVSGYWGFGNGHLDLQEQVSRVVSSWTQFTKWRQGVLTVQFSPALNRVIFDLSDMTVVHDFPFRAPRITQGNQAVEIGLS